MKKSNEASPFMYGAGYKNLLTSALKTSTCRAALTPAQLAELPFTRLGNTSPRAWGNLGETMSSIRQGSNIDGAQKLKALSLTTRLSLLTLYLPVVLDPEIKPYYPDHCRDDWVSDVSFLYVGDDPNATIFSIFSEAELIEAPKRLLKNRKFQQAHKKFHADNGLEMKLPFDIMK